MLFRQSLTDIGPGRLDKLKLGSLWSSSEQDAEIFWNKISLQCDFSYHDLNQGKFWAFSRGFGVELWTFLDRESFFLSCLMGFFMCSV
jgi:hypothetical protein